MRLLFNFLFFLAILAQSLLRAAHQHFDCLFFLKNKTALFWTSTFNEILIGITLGLHILITVGMKFFCMPLNLEASFFFWRLAAVDNRLKPSI